MGTNGEQPLTQLAEAGPMLRLMRPALAHEAIVLAGAGLRALQSMLVIFVQKQLEIPKKGAIWTYFSAIYGIYPDFTVT